MKAPQIVAQQPAPRRTCPACGTRGQVLLRRCPKCGARYLGRRVKGAIH